LLKKLRAVFIISFLGLMCSFPAYAGEAKTITQFSTIDALIGGVYDGIASIRQLKQYGDIGIGTFDALNGEMMMVDGIVYRVSADGGVQIPGPDETTPFAAVTFFEPDRESSLPENISMQELAKAVDGVLPTLNFVYVLRIEGTFKKVKTRSVPKQSKPYPPLIKVTQTQPTFDFENVEGVIVGVRCPGYMKGINVPGYHLHFLTKDGKAGGHVLELTTDHVVAKIDRIRNFHMILPEDSDFYKLDLDKDASREVTAVESGK
jgi:acetolactate decarboxylase